jgi:Zn-dependent protease
MRWSFPIGSIAGIRLQVHVTFLLLLILVAAASGLLEGHFAEALGSVGLVLLTFACVVLHELGHALAARRYGIRTRDITLLPIGGIARLERMPSDPRQEIVVALAGPAVNVVIATALAIVLTALHIPLIQAMRSEGALPWVFKINVFMLLFNLIPAFPMDGGRVFRALLATRLSYERATRVASNVGQFVAVLFAAVGVIWGNMILVIIALFVFLAAGEERTIVQTRASIQGVPVRDAMVTEFHRLAVHDPLRLAVDHLMAGSQQDFPVMADGMPVGILSRDQLVAGIARHGIEAPVGSVLKRNVTWVDAAEPLESVLQRMRESGLAALPVRDGERLVGMLTLDNVGDLLMVRQALRSHLGSATA